MTFLLSFQPSAHGSTPGTTVLQRTASTPSVVRLPSSHLPQVIRPQSAQVVTNPTGAATPGRTKIITVKRVGPNGSVTQSRSFAISADANITGSQKIIVQKPNGSSQVARTGSPAAVAIQQSASQPPGPMKIPISVVQATMGNSAITNQNLTSSVNSNGGNSFESHFQQFAQSFQSNSSNISVKISDQPKATSAVNSQPHVIQITRPLSATTNPVVARTLSQTARLVSSQAVLNSASPSIRVIQRPFQNNTTTSPSLQHSQSVPANMSDFNLSNFPTRLLENRDAGSPPMVLARQQGLGASKMILNDNFPNGFDMDNPMAMSMLSAMHRSVQNIPIPKITNKDVSRMWSTPDMKLRNITSNVSCMRA